ncbi:MAG: hypothetical protein LBU37_02275 [Tannerellaceae bacterium]|nr:hypothetical protein [Tannerellaceae bacterium]
MLGFLFLLDVVFGILVDIVKNDDHIRIKKLLVSVAFLTMYFLIIASTYVIGERMDDAPEALYIVKILTYVFSYFYAANILRNMHNLTPDNRALAFLDYFLGLQVIKYLPDLARFLKLTSGDKRNNKKQKKQ